jgi:putative ABC transport system permease protein
VKFIETLKLAISAVWAHKLRSVLTLLGMIIGVTAVIVVVSLIQGFNKYVDEKIANIGAKSYQIYRFDFFKDFKDTDTIAAAQRRNKELLMDDYEFLRERLQLTAEFGAKAAPQRAQVKRGDVILEAIPVGGVTANIATIEKIDIEDGRFFSDAENEAASRVAFIGADLVEKLFPGGSPVGGEIEIRGLDFRVIGVAVAKGTLFGMPQDNFVTIPIKTYERTFGPIGRNRWLQFTGTSLTDPLFDDAVEEARYWMRIRRRLPANEEDTFAVVTPDLIMGARDRIIGPIAIVAVVVPGIALVIGGIVIMNIMLVSVTERTKEIGIRKALGARRRDILKQFLVEAITLSAIGGAMGIFLAWLIGLIVSAYVLETYLSVLAIVIAVFVSSSIGILAGIFPAWRASRLDPIEALRAD